MTYAHAHAHAHANAVHAHATPIDVSALGNTRVSEDGARLLADYAYRRTLVDTTNTQGQSQHRVREVVTDYRLQTDVRVPRLGLMLVGWGGNNGSTLTASLIANRERMSWQTRNGTQHANYLGSVVMAATVKLGLDAKTDRDVYVPLRDLLPMVHPNDLAVGGWDISATDLATAMDRGCVLEPDLKRQLRDKMSGMKPLPSIFYPGFIADNQLERADNLINDPTDGAVQNKQRDCDRIRADIRRFKAEQQVDKVIVLWTATTERRMMCYAEILPGVNDTADAVLAAVGSSHAEIAPSTVFAVASILEGATFINGSPQNTFVPGVLALAEQHGVNVAGDDFKSGQTKLKSVLAEFLVGAGMKPLAITSYNHLGNNDGLNLSSQPQFRSKEISKRNVVDDMVESNEILYKPGEHPDHTVVIKYVPAVGDSKRAMDEYYTEIFMGGTSTIAIHNVCEDSLLAAPLIIDLAIIAELLSRINYRIVAATEPRLSQMSNTATTAECKHPAYEPLHSVLSLLSYFLKAPIVEPGAPVVNALARQRASLVNMLRACVGLHADPEIPLRQTRLATKSQ